MMDRVETKSNRVVCAEPQAAPSASPVSSTPSRVQGITIAAVLACLGAMASFVWVANSLWGSVGMGVLLVLSLSAAFALPELLLIAFAQLQDDASKDDGSDTRHPG